MHYLFIGVIFSAESLADNSSATASDQEQTGTGNVTPNNDQNIEEMHIHIDVHSRERENKQRKISQKNRMTGKAYEGLKKNKIMKKWEYVLKQPRAIGDRERVCGKKCKAESTVAACPQITDEQRAQLFDSYWKMNWDQRRIYIASMVTNYPPKRRRQGQQQSHRSVTFRYHFKLSGVLIPVCKNFFLSTLDMKEWFVKEWSRTASATNTSIPVQKVNTPARSHKNENISASAKKFLKSLAKLPSHYCRANADKQYLEPAFETYVDLHREYELFCEKNDLLVASLTTQKSIFKTMRMSFFSPKKDQCDLCVSYKAGNVSELGYTQHLQRKHAARDEKKHDIELCLQENSMVVVLFVDLQKVLLAPAFNASAFYYKTKLCS